MSYPEKSKVVEYLMPKATEEEKAEATGRWFRFIRIVDRIATRLEDEETALKAEIKKNPPVMPSKERLV